MLNDVPGPVAKALIRASDTAALRRSEMFKTTETTSVRRPNS